VRILHLGKFYPPHRGGIETHLETLCRGLAPTAAVEVIVANDSRRSVTEDLDGVRVRRLATIFTPASTPICPSMISALRSTSADLIHLHVPNPYAALAFLLGRSSAPLLISWHSDVVRQKQLARLFAPIERAIVRRAAALIASSSNYPESSPTLARNRSHVRVIPYGIEPTEFRPHDPARIAKIRARYGPRIVLGVGRLVYYKGFENLIQAMAGVACQLLIVGEGPLRIRLERTARAAGVGARVSFLGDLSRDELIDTYHASDVFVLPAIARSEAFGIVQLEAMACGKPVVNTRLASGVPFVSIDRETGITVEPARPEGLAVALNLLLDDPDLRARYGAAGVRRVCEQFSAATMVERTLALYREVLGERLRADQ